MPPGLRVVNSNDVGISGSGTTGVVGTGTPGDTSGPGGEGVGVSGSGSMGVIGQGDLFGVFGGGAPGVFGTSKDVGVSGLGATGVAGSGTSVGVHGSSPGIGVAGFSQSDTGVRGDGGHTGVNGVGSVVGVRGEATAPPSPDGTSGTGVFGMAPPGGAGIGADATLNDAPWALIAWATNPSASAAVLALGDFVATGSKLALVKLRNGDHRGLYCMESPECWFEDFGRARLVRGRARVRLDRTFGQVVRTDNFHVFLSPEGLCQGLYVSRRGRGGFEVRELHQGKSTVMFSYRIVARRKDVDAPRFKRMKLPFLKVPEPAKLRSPQPPEVPTLPEPVRTPQLEALRKRAQVTKPRPGRRGTARAHTRRPAHGRRRTR